VASRIPAIVNVASGTADEARTVLEQSDSFEVHEVQPDEIAPTIRRVIAHSLRSASSSGFA